jgi:hypothetical protein
MAHYNASLNAPQEESKMGWAGLGGMFAGSLMNQGGGMMGGGGGGGGMMGGMFEEGGEVDDLPSGPGAVDVAGQYLDEGMSPSGGAETDDIPAVAPGGAVARLNKGEFVMPERTVNFYGTKWMQQQIDKADKQMGIEPQPPAAPEMKPVAQFASGGAVSRGNGSNAVRAPRMAGMPRMGTRMDRPNVTMGIPGALRRGVSQGAMGRVAGAR